MRHGVCFKISRTVIEGKLLFMNGTIKQVFFIRKGNQFKTCNNFIAVKFLTMKWQLNLHFDSTQNKIKNLYHNI